MSFYDDLEKSLCEAIQIEKGIVSVMLKEDMPAPTYVSYTKENIKITDKNM